VRAGRKTVRVKLSRLRAKILDGRAGTALRPLCATGAEQAHRRSSERRPCFRRHSEFRRRGSRRQATERPRRMAARLRHQVPIQRKSPSACARFMTASLLFSPVPYLAKGFLYLRIDPDRLAAKRVDFVLATDDVGGLEVRTRRRGVDRSGGRSRCLRRQHRRLSNALGQRHLRFNAAPCCHPARQRAVFDCLFLRPESGRDRRNNSHLCAARKTYPLPADLGLRLFETASGCEQAKPSLIRELKRSTPDETNRRAFDENRPIFAAEELQSTQTRKTRCALVNQCACSLFVHRLGRKAMKHQRYFKPARGEAK
jgi:hypothetical protein